MKSFIQGELTSVESNELEAAALAVNESLRRARFSTATLFEADLELARLEAIVRAADPDAATRSSLSEPGTAVYDALLSESVKYIVSTVVRMPSFQSAEASELLSRTSSLSQLVIDVLNSLPKSSVPARWGAGTESAAFENKYRTSIFNFADRIRLFGVSSQYGTSTYSLSVAYISLSIEDDATGLAVADGPEMLQKIRDISDLKSGAEDPLGADEHIRVERALSRGPRVLVAGGAGSGKTTLLQWIACKAAQNSFDEDLVDWNGSVPFFIPLRRFVGIALPAPEQFLSTTSSSLAGAMPRGWVHEVLAEGRGVILVDGMDELPESQRSEVKEWLDELIREFPENKFILTSRTTAIDESWATLPDFKRVALVPMDLPDISAFVEHWHDAAEASPTNDQSADELRTARQNILRAVRNKPAIRALCTSPLLCALICALNRERGSQIPDNRMDLYAVALEMLIKRRDDERGILASPNVSMTYKEAVLLLRSFAVWLHENGRADSSFREFRERLTRVLPSLHNVKGSAPEVANYLLVRSGVLREPVAGRVDFVHRTFLEYLAAAEIVEDSSIEKLVIHAHEDHWREVVVMGAGHAGRAARGTLIRGLIDRGTNEPVFRHKIYLLAVACMETATSLTVEIQQELENCLASVVPPRNMTDAAAIASAGQLAVPLLAGFSNELATTAAASIRALVLIGGPEALDALTSYARDSRVTVARQLIRAWSSFELDEYAAKVLADSPLDYGHIRITDPSQLQHLSKLNRLEAAHLDLDFRIADLSSIPALPSIHTLRASYMHRITDMRSLQNPAGFTGLKSLTLTGARALESLNGIQDLPALEELDLDACVSIEDFTPASEITTLKSLSVSLTNITSLEPFERTHLDMLYAINCQQLVTLGKEITSEFLMVDLSENLSDISALIGSSALRDVYITVNHSPHKSIVLPSQLQNLTYRQEGGPELSLSGGSALEHIKFFNFEIEGENSNYLTSLENLSSLSLTYIGKTQIQPQLQSLSGSPALQQIDVQNFGAPVKWPEIAGFAKRESRHRVTYSR